MLSTNSCDEISNSKHSEAHDIWAHTVENQNPKRFSFRTPDDFILMHNSIDKSAKYNFEGCKFPLDTDLNIDCFRFMLLDQSLCDLLEFGFPIGYMG